MILWILTQSTPALEGNASTALSRDPEPNVLSADAFIQIFATFAAFC